MAEMLGTCVYLLAGGVLWRARQAFAHSTVQAAWYGCALAWVAWGGAWFAQLAAGPESARHVAPAWYLAAVLFLCPPIAVLGARRPGARVWAAFILLPLVLVLSWPALAQLPSVWRGNPMQLETPSVVAFALVAIMGLGNYVGTRFSLPAILLGGALWQVVAPLTGSVEAAIGFAAAFRATLCLGAAAALAAVVESAARPIPPSLDRVWIDFRNLFGIVWSKRLMERVNDTARRENWPARLEIDGLHWPSPDVTPGQRLLTEQRVEYTLRWLLRRFVDPPWIDARLPPSGQSVETRLPAVRQQPEPLEAAARPMPTRAAAPTVEEGPNGNVQKSC